MKTIIVNCRAREQRVAVLDGKQLEHIHIMNKVNESLVGNIYAGRVEKVVPGMDAAFVNIGLDKNAFLQREDIAGYQNSIHSEVPINKLIAEGEKLLVQVVRDETAFKGARVSGCIELSTPYMVYLAGRHYISLSKKMTPEERGYWKSVAEQCKQTGEGLLVRTEMRTKDAGFLKEQLEACRKAYGQLQAKLSKAAAGELLFCEDQLEKTIKKIQKRSGQTSIHVDNFEIFQAWKHDYPDWDVHFYRDAENIFAVWHIESMLAKLYNRVVWLENGSFLVIEEGEAMTTIDVNTGKFTGKHGKKDTAMQVNLMAAEEVMRQIRLRNLSGIILIDFINCSSESEKNRIVQCIKAEQRKDENTLQIAGFTELGILQLTRKVKAESLLQSTTVPCPACNGTGRVENASSAAFRLERELYSYRSQDYSSGIVEATSDILAYYTGENASFKKKLEDDCGMKLTFQTIDEQAPLYRIKELTRD
ncbi:MAG: Rne/Rng family ribonuclease [Bacillus sp. (in: firmicutes)]